jgi:hypothetical protein
MFCMLNDSAGQRTHDASSKVRSYFHVVPKEVPSGETRMEMSAKCRRPTRQMLDKLDASSADHWRYQHAR